MANYEGYDRQARDHGRHDRDFDDRNRERERSGRDQDDGRGRGVFGSNWGRGDQRPERGPRDEQARRDEPVRRDEHASRDEPGRRDEPSRRDEQGRQSERQGGEFGYDDRHEGLPIDETGRLIASNKVEGTAVYARDRARIGSIYNFMVDKRSGEVEYVVMTYGGFLGMGTRYYPMPWDILSYDTRLGGYRIDMLERDLERAPSFDRQSEPEFDTAYGQRVRGWYGVGR